MPDLAAYDNESAWMGACIPKHIDEGQSQEQAVAACLAQWRDKDKDKKAGRRLRGEWLQKLKDMKAAFADWLKNLSEMEKWADYGDLPDEDEDDAKRPRKALSTFKAKDGRTWLLTWTTNAFIDRDKEIFTTKSIEEYVTRHEGDDSKGKFQLWHLPGTEFGEIRWQGVVGRFLAEAGPFDDTPTGQRFKQFFMANPDGHAEHAPSGWATSHGYNYKEGDRDDGVYDWFEKQETSVLPFEAAANQHNPQPEVLSMNDRQKQLLRDIGGDELVESVIKTGEARTKELEEQGIAYKGETTEAQPEAAKCECETPAPEAAPALDLKAIVDGLHLEGLDETLKVHEAGLTALIAQVKALSEQVAALAKADEQKTAEKMLAIPRFSWMRASQAAGTVLNPTDPADVALKTRKPVPNAIAGIAAKMGG